MTADNLIPEIPRRINVVIFSLKPGESVAEPFNISTYMAFLGKSYYTQSKVDKGN
jgi:hypothetical protein